MNFWNNFAAKHPAAAKWVREGGLFVIVSNLITVFKYLLLQFLPKAFASLPVVDFGWPGIDITLFGETFKWNILGYDAAHGGLPYFCAYMIAMVIGECINFPIQRNFVFRSKGNLAKQIGWYVLAFCVITCIVNSINCIWVAVAGLLVPDFIYNIGNTHNGQPFRKIHGIIIHRFNYHLSASIHITILPVVRVHQRQSFLKIMCHPYFMPLVIIHNRHLLPEFIHHEQRLILLFLRKRHLLEKITDSGKTLG